MSEPTDELDDRGEAPPPPGGWSATATAAPPAPPAPKAPAGVGMLPPEGRPRGAFIGGMLVLLGVLLLLLNVVPGLSLIRFWPVIVIVIGVVQAITRGHEGRPRVNRVFDGFVTISMGAVLLACSIGVLPWMVWWSVFSLWPVLLISAGLGILGRGTGHEWLGAVGSVLVMAALFFGAFALPATGGAFPFLPRGVGAGQHFAREIPMPVPRPDTARLELDAGVGTVDLRSGPDLVSVEGVASRGGAPEIETSSSGKIEVVKVSFPERTAFVYPGSAGPRSDVRLRRGGIIWDRVDVQAGVATVDADLRDLRVGDLVLETGVSSAEVRLGPGAPGGSTARIKGGVSTVRVLVPRTADCTVRVDRGLTGVTVGDGFEPEGENVWQARAEDPQPGSTYIMLPSRWSIVVESGVGSVDIVRY